ncbi:small-conductance mechanosensitive channel [Bradyrhizobium elkanii]
MDMSLKDVLESIQMAARSVGAEVASPWFYLQFGIILAAAGLAYAADTAIHARVDMASLAMRWPLPLRHFARVMVKSASTAVFAVLMVISRIVMWHATWPSRSYLIAVSAKLALAWLVIRLVTSVIDNAFIVKLVSIAAWVVAALSIIGQLDWAAETLDSFAVVVGGLRLTPLLLIKAGALLIVALWLSNIASNFIDGQITRSTDLTPSIQVLLVKIIRIGLMVVAVAIALSAVGINLSALAVLSGAVGVGIGFGLQKIVANFISGIILLVDKSVKPGDLVTIGDSQGRISAMKTRYISVAAGDGREFLIPNEDLVTQNGHQLDLYRQEYAGEDRFRRQLRRRSKAGLQARDRYRRGPRPRAQGQAAELHPHRIRRTRHEVLADLLDRRPRRHGQCEERRHAGAVGRLQAAGHPGALPGAGTPHPRRRAAGRERGRGLQLALERDLFAGPVAAVPNCARKSSRLDMSPCSSLACAGRADH